MSEEQATAAPLAPFALPSEAGGLPSLNGALAAALERVAGLAATVLRTPSAFVSLLGADRRCFAAGPAVPRWLAHDPGALFRSGLSARLLMADEPTVLCDARADASTAVASAARELGVGAFLGTRLVTEDGERSAIFCVVDTVPRQWSTADVRIFTEVGRTAITELELQRRTDVAEQFERQLRHDALHDRLTGLPNRAFFVERVRLAVERARRQRDECFAVLVLDLDNFKAVNESFGHHAGDEMLLEVARRFARGLRTVDMLARLGGDEFALLLENIREPSDGARVAERLQASLHQPIRVGDDEVFASVSVGIAARGEGEEPAQHYLRSADLAMYRAKERGRGQFQVFDPVMHEDAIRRLRLETDLRRALERDQLTLHYQPVVSLASGRIVAVEALLRWEHPERGMIPPNDFLSVAEEASLIGEIGRWVTRRACRQLQAWRQDHGEDAPESVWVNLSVKQFSHPAFAQEVAAVLRELAFEPERLTLEITEGVVIENLELALRTLAELRGLGVRVFMDDFGTGYSSLGYLDRLSLDGIKIDRAFIAQMGQGERPLQLVRTIVALIRNLGFEPIAEGVETDEQLRLLREMGCAYAQGFLFSRAIAPERLAKLLKVRVR